MTKREGYPLNYEFWESGQYDAKLDWPPNPIQKVRVIGHEEVILNHFGYDIPDGFMLIEYEDGRIGSIHKKWLYGT